MNIDFNFEDLIAKDSDDFINHLVELSVKINKQEGYCVNNHKILSKRVYIDGIYIDEIKNEKVKKIYIPEAKIEYTVCNKISLKNEIKEIFNSELNAVAIDADELESTAASLAERLNLEHSDFNHITNDYYTKNQVDNLNEIIYVDKIFLVEQKEILFDSEYIEPDVFIEKTKDIDKHNFISHSYYLLIDEDSTTNEILVLKMIEFLLNKNIIDDLKAKLLIKRYNREIENEKKYSYRIVCI